MLSMVVQVNVVGLLLLTVTKKEMMNILHYYCSSTSTITIQSQYAFDLLQYNM